MGFRHSTVIELSESWPHTTPITRNHLFAPSFLDSAFRLWERNGIQTFTDLYIGRVFGSFTDLSASHNLPTTHLLRYFQIS